MSVDELADVKMQMDLLDWDETFVQACFAKSDDEVKSIVESFRNQLAAAGIDRFEAYVKSVYEEDPNAVKILPASGGRQGKEKRISYTYRKDWVRNA